MNVLPLFKTHYSLGRSILTLNAAEKELDASYPVSVFDIAKQHSLSQVTVVDDSISGFLEAHQNAKKAKVKLVFGVQLRVVGNIEQKDENTLKSLSKVIVFMKNTAGYADLIKITSCASKKGFYYKPNIDWKHLGGLWSDNLTLAIPFYDGFIAKNMLHGNVIVPDFGFAKSQPTFLYEESALPFDGLIQRKVAAYAGSIGAPMLQARSIFYYRREDFLAYLTFRCIHERTNLEKPEIEHCSSDSFCFEMWQAQEATPTTI